MTLHLNQSSCHRYERPVNTNRIAVHRELASQANLCVNQNFPWPRRVLDTLNLNGGFVAAGGSNCGNNRT